MIDWSEDQLLLRKSLRQFVEQEIEPVRNELEFGDLPPYEILRKMYATFGLDDLAEERFEKSQKPRAADSRPKSKMRDPMELAAVLLPLLELSRCSPGLVTALGVSVNLTAGAILRRGTHAQRERWGRDILTLRKVGSWALTEPGSGSDAFGSMLATATPDGGGFLLNGSKTFITNGPYADTIVFICKLNDGSEPSKRPVVSFVLDRGMPGLEQSSPLHKMGMHSSPTGELFLQNVYVEDDRLLGGRESLSEEKSSKPTSGARSGAKATFVAERASIAAMSLGIIERCQEVAVEFARNRTQFGKPIGKFQLIQAQLANMEIARLNVQNSVFRYMELLESGFTVSLGEASAMKLYAAKAAVDVAMSAVQILGGNGYMSEYPVEQLARDARVLQIYAGTDEMQTIAVAEELLQLDY